MHACVCCVHMCVHASRGEGRGASSAKMKNEAWCDKAGQLVSLTVFGRLPLSRDPDCSSSSSVQKKFMYGKKLKCNVGTPKGRLPSLNSSSRHLLRRLRSPRDAQHFSRSVEQ